MGRAAVLAAIFASVYAFAVTAAEPALPAPAVEAPGSHPLYALVPPAAAPAAATVATEPVVSPAAPVAQKQVAPEVLDLGKADAAEPAPGEELSLGWTLLRTLVVLGVVIFAIYISLNFGLRRLMGVSAMPRALGVVQVVERIPLDQKRAMFVVKAAGEYLLIGGGDGALQLIAKLDAAEVEKLQHQAPPSLSLSPLLQKLLKRRETAAPPAPGDHR